MPTWGADTPQVFLSDLLPLCNLISSWPVQTVQHKNRLSGVLAMPELAKRYKPVALFYFVKWHSVTRAVPCRQQHMPLYP
ncbi:hypothetical protein HaLaN_01777, partial [Haematococcus lacustris]